MPLARLNVFNIGEVVAAKSTTLVNHDSVQLVNEGTILQVPVHQLSILLLNLHE